ncbi:haloalkane dehalogenase [Roseibium sp. HPY-6]|uniref:haloalkane dehalogenase n=1 Tax=Roseibium sp. HPY-6 TaxID=3229852 RepID=UPI00338E58B6
MSGKLSFETTRRRLLTGAATGGAALALPLAGTAIAQEGAKPLGSDPSAPYGIQISAEFPFKKKEMSVLDSSLAYVDEGDGQPVVFLHGNPTSSYLWRNIIPHVSESHRAIAPDLIGMGDSGKPDGDYRFADHARYLDTFLDQLDLSDAILVVHDWGSALGMRYARQNPDRVSGLVFLEAIVPPVLPVASFDDMPGPLADFFRLMHSDKGADMVLNENFFVEFVLPQMGVVRAMSDAEMDHYRRPFPTPDSRKPVLAWPREVPIEGKPADVVEEVRLNGEWLLSSQVPKLMFYAEPGALMPKPVADYLTANVANIEARFVGAGSHFLQEDHPHVIGQGIADWLRRI